MRYPEIPDGLEISTLNHIASISSYNYNYYEYNGKLLCGISDDDNTTDWYLVIHESFSFLGQSNTYSFFNEKVNIINRMEQMPT